MVGVIYRHAQQAGDVVLERKALVREGAGAVDACGPGAVAVEKVASLDHEVLDLPVEKSW